MHIGLRRLVFAAFVLVFLVTAPLVVLYTAGYRLNISNQRLQQTGVLAITTLPRGANIVLNGQDIAQKSPYVIQRLMPNTHDVLLQKKGYHDWSQRLPVEEGKTSYVSARLFADTKPVALDLAGSALALRSKEKSTVPDSDEASIYFLNNGANIEVLTGISPNAHLIALLPLGNYHLLEDDAEYLIIADDYQTAFMIARQGGEVVALSTRLLAFDWLANENLLLWTDGTEVNSYAANTREKMFITREGETIIDLAWHPEADSFFIATATELTAYDYAVYETREVTPLLASTELTNIWLDDAGKNLYFLKTPLTTPPPQPPVVYELPLSL